MVSALCLFLVFRKVDIQEVFKVLASTDYMCLLYAAIIGTSKLWLMSFRWRFFFPAVNRPATEKFFHFYSVGNMVSMMLPFRAGDFFRGLMVAEELKIPNSRVLGTIASEHILDFFVLCCLLVTTLGLYSYQWPTQMIPTVIVFSVIAALIVGGLWFLRKNFQMTKRFKATIQKFLPNWIIYFFNMALSFYSGFFQLKGFANILKVIGGTIGIWIAQGLWIYVMFCSLGLTEGYSLGGESVLVMIVMMGFAVMIPSSPSYLGTLHLMVVLGLEQMGVPTAIALSYAILVHAYGTAIAILIGLYSLWKGNFKIQFNAMNKRFVGQAAT